MTCFSSKLSLHFYRYLCNNNRRNSYENDNGNDNDNDNNNDADGVDDDDNDNDDEDDDDNNDDTFEAIKYTAFLALLGSTCVEKLRQFEFLTLAIKISFLFDFCTDVLLTVNISKRHFWSCKLLNS